MGLVAAWQDAMPIQCQCRQLLDPTIEQRAAVSELVIDGFRFAVFRQNIFNRRLSRHRLSCENRRVAEQERFMFVPGNIGIKQPPALAGGCLILDKS